METKKHDSNEHDTRRTWFENIYFNGKKILMEFLFPFSMYLYVVADES